MVVPGHRLHLPDGALQRPARRRVGLVRHERVRFRALSVFPVHHHAASRVPTQQVVTVRDGEHGARGWGVDREARHPLDERGREVRGERGRFQKHVQKLEETPPVRGAEAARVQQPVESVVEFGVLQLVLGHQMEYAVQRQHAVETAPVDGRGEKVRQRHGRRHVRHHVRVRSNQDLAVDVIRKRRAEEREPGALKQLPSPFPVRPFVPLFRRLGAARVRLLRGGGDRLLAPLGGEFFAVPPLIRRRVNRGELADGYPLAPRAVRVLGTPLGIPPAVAPAPAPARRGVRVRALHQAQHRLEVLAVVVVVVVGFFLFLRSSRLHRGRPRASSRAGVVRKVRRASDQDVV